MRFVSPVLKKILYPAMHHSRWLKRLAPSGGCAVVNYHGVIPPGYESRDAFLDGNLVSEGTLRTQLRFLKANYDLITPAEFRNWIQSGSALPPRAMLVTCDDGLLNNLLDMLPILKSEKTECLFFVTGASCSDNPGMLWYEELYWMLRSGKLSKEELGQLLESDTRPVISADFPAIWWKAVLNASRWHGALRVERMTLWRTRCALTLPASGERRWRLLNLDELRQLAGAGMTIGAHTLSHPVLAECDEAESAREISESKTRLERALAQPIWAFAYPFGNPQTMGAREIGLAREAGFECAFLNVGGGFSPRSQPLAFSRTHITADMSLAEVEAHVIGFHARLQNAVRG